MTRTNIEEEGVDCKGSDRYRVGSYHFKGMTI